MDEVQARLTRMRDLGIEFLKINELKGSRILEGEAGWACPQSESPVAGSFEKNLERETGFEPATLALARRCSTTELFPLPGEGNSILPTVLRGVKLTGERR